MRMIRVFLPLVLILGLVAMALPAGAGHAEFARTECVYGTGNPVVSTSHKGTVVHYDNFPFVGVLTDDAGVTTGSNTGVVDIAINVKNGTGSISGTLAIRDDVMGNFDGTFKGRYHDFQWSGLGFADGIGDDAGMRLKVKLQGFPKDQCPADPELGDAVDGAKWTVTIKT